MNLPLFFLSLALGILIAGGAYLLHALTAGGAVTAAMTVAGTLYFGGFPAFLVLLFSFLVISVVGRLTKKKREPIESLVPEKTGARDAIQVGVNGGVGLLSLMMGTVLQEPLFTLLFVAAIAEALADSMASEIGVLSKKPPRDICTWRIVTSGKSGGVSLLGSLSAVLGAGLTVFLAFLLFPDFAPLDFLLVLLAATLGVLCDSILGSRLQKRSRCAVCGKFTEKREHCGERTVQTGGISFLSNDAVNLLSNLVSALFAAPLLFLL